MEFFENENFAARVPKIWIWTSKIMPDLWFRAVFCQLKKKSLHPTLHLPHHTTTHQPLKKDLFRRQGEGRHVRLEDRILAALAVLPQSFLNKRMS